MEEQNIEKFGNPADWRFSPLTGEPLHKGLENWKRLFKKPSFTDWITLVVIVLALIGAYMYNTEVKACHETLNNLDKICVERQASDEAQRSANPGLLPSSLDLNNISLSNSVGSS